MPLGFASLILIGSSLFIALLCFALMKLGIVIARRSLPENHPSQLRLLELSQNSLVLLQWLTRRLPWFLLVSLLIGFTVATIWYS